MINVAEIKQKILKSLEEKGPSLPLQISKVVELSPMFTSAILSELINERRVKLSNMKIGSSPLYLLPGHEQQLENFLDNITGIEKTALLRLKENKILEDSEQETPIKVALRGIKDFAIPFKNGDKLFWKYAFLNEDINLQKLSHEKPKIEIQVQQKIPQQKKPEPIFESPIKQIPKLKKISQNFLGEVKEFLEKRNIVLISLEHFDRKKVVAIVNFNAQKHLLAAFNKKRITEAELIKIYRQSAELSLPYYIITTGESTKKMQELNNAYRNLTKIDVLE